jgi:copper chaperone CopZ
MADVSFRDQLLLIWVEGMHCYKCEERIVAALGRLRGVNEVEVDFPSGLASVLYDGSVPIPDMVNAVIAAGYRPTGVEQQSPGWLAA